MNITVGKKRLKIQVEKETIERQGGDGDWVKYTYGKLLDNNCDLINGNMYTILWEKYTVPFLILDNKGDIALYFLVQ